MPPDREDVLNELTGNDQPDTTAADTQQANTIDAPVDSGAEAGKAASDAPAGAKAAEAITPMGGEATKSFLDSITEGAEAARATDVKATPKDSADQSGEKADPKDAEAAAGAADKPNAGASQKTPEQEADELIAEMGVKSPRGQERIKAVFAKSKELEAAVAERTADINEFREMVTSTGMAPQEFAQMLEVGKLIKSNEPAQLKVALQMIDQQRAAIAMQLGEALPGVDLLADFPDLKQKVENMELTPEAAAELAKYKRNERQQQQARQVQQAQQQDMQQFQQTIQQVATTAEAYFDTRKAEADYPAKMKAIHAKFREPGYVDEFVRTYEPKQWFGVFKLMYDSMTVPATSAQHGAQPIRSRPTNAGAPAANPNAPLSDRLMSHLDSMGL